MQNLPLTPPSSSVSGSSPDFSDGEDSTIDPNSSLIIASRQLPKENHFANLLKPSPTLQKAIHTRQLEEAETVRDCKKIKLARTEYPAIPISLNPPDSAGQPSIAVGTANQSPQTPSGRGNGIEDSHLADALNSLRADRRALLESTTEEGQALGQSLEYLQKLLTSGNSDSAAFMSTSLEILDDIDDYFRGEAINIDEFATAMADLWTQMSKFQLPQPSPAPGDIDLANQDQSASQLNAHLSSSKAKKLGEKIEVLRQSLANSPITRETFLDDFFKLAKKIILTRDLAAINSDEHAELMRNLKGQLIAGLRLPVVNIGQGQIASAV